MAYEVCREDGIVLLRFHLCSFVCMVVQGVTSSTNHSCGVCIIHSGDFEIQQAAPVETIGTVDT
jgi:hypothetical protein